MKTVKMRRGKQTFLPGIFPVFTGCCGIRLAARPPCPLKTNVFQAASGNCLKVKMYVP
ncbi:MAG: hypothetical protein IJB69_07305 [Clostridia bacterium]|nr:hypothetical protein [Clostridia bacterium]